MNNYHNNNIDMSEILNEYLANLKVLITNLYNVHWNVVGGDFFPVHAKMQEYYETTTDMYDEVAERIKMLGKYPITSLCEYEQKASLKSLCSKDYSIEETFEIVAKQFNYMLEFSNAIYTYANQIDDANTVELMTDYIQFFEKQLWMLKASLK